MSAIQSSTEKFIARPYQDELIQKALKEDIICVLGTGTGKTYIAVQVIQHERHELIEDLENGGKRSVFLVPTVALVEQQGTVLCRHTGLSVGKYCSSENIDDLDKSGWQNEFRTKKILVMVPDVLKYLLEKAFLLPKHINRLIVDECHHAGGEEHPYRQIMRIFLRARTDGGPRILGLTASGINIRLKKKNMSPQDQLEDEIKQLEACLGCKVVTSLDESLNEYGARPSPDIVTFEVVQPNGTDHEILKRVEETVNWLDSARKRNFSSRPANLNASPLDSEKWVKDSIKEIKNAVFQVQNTLTTMGIYCAYITCQQLLKDLKMMLGRGLFRLELSALVRDCICRLRQIGNSFEAAYSIQQAQANCSELFLLGLVTPKVMKLLELFQPYSLASTAAGENSNELCCIVFVQERYSAWALHQFLRLLRTTKEKNYEWINTGFCVGQLDESGSEETIGNKIGLSATQLKATLSKFRSGDLNVLIATDIVEEGFDVRECNLIIRFNEPTTYRSYVQSKGRARAKNSKFLMMICCDEVERFRNGRLHEFQLVDVVLKDHCVDRSSPTEQDRIDHFSDEKYPPYRPQGSSACVTLGSALNCLQRYCNSLPNDKMTTCLVVPDIINLPAGGSSGPEMESPVLAKKAAALVCCQMLHERGELSTEHLLPKDDGVEWKDAVAQFVGYREKEPVPAGSAQPGTRRRSQFYPRTMPSTLNGSTPAVGRMFLHQIVWKKAGRIAANMDTIVNLNMDFPVGFLSGRQLMPMPNFPLCHGLNQYEVDVRFIRWVDGEITPAALQRLQECHRCIFEDILGFGKDQWKYAPELLADSIVIVPLSCNGVCSVNWSLVDRLIRPGAFVINQSMAAADRARMAMDANSYRHAVVVTSYKPEEPSGRYFVMDIPAGYTPTNYIVKEKNNVVQHMMGKYGYSVQHPHSPLLHVRHISKELNFTPKRSDVKTAPKKDIHLPMEFCHVLPFCVQWYQSFRILPYVLYRLRTMHNVYDLYQKIGTALWGVVYPPERWKPLVYHPKYHDVYMRPPPPPTSSDSLPSLTGSRDSESSPAEEHGIFYEKFRQMMYYKSRERKKNQPAKRCPSSALPVSSFTPFATPNQIATANGSLNNLVAPPQTFDHEFSSTAKTSLPEVTSFVKSVTTACAGDCFNMERMETIGDAFLKMTTCLYLFMEYPKYHEGRLTEIKGIQVSNYNLYRLGKLKNLEKYIVNFNVMGDVRRYYLPPGFIPLDSSQEPERCTQSLRDKSLADVVEALIGMMLLEVNAYYAQRFMEWMGLKAIHSRGTIGSGQINKTFSSLRRTEDDPLFQELSTLVAPFADFEKRIGYIFQDKSYLLQAFSHNSDFRNQLTDCYQRLEFLGDSILDYLVTRHIHEADQTLSPGKLTDVRMALVNNKTFAKLAVKYGYHQYVRYQAPKMFQLISRFAEEVKKEDPDVEVLQASDVYADFEDDEEEVHTDIYEAAETPKVLGDIFESVAGAIFLDSGLSLDAVWKVYYNLMRKRIDFCLKHCPKNSVRVLLEYDPNNVHFSLEGTDKGKMVATVEITDKGVFRGQGNNSRAAKCNAAIEALRALYPESLPCD
ncbi:endoribonuclease Dicer-like [Paramacrobiotus metropolitanus]|uniref:endoribonuclease Dicer-like n=1 Tax=Paramacrobiotus metropolitanus TaxID=2943436 RepID=UPI0024464259|nr:endoribonuclease Dicer-like [Paramacrobiotus metropolitanus]